MLDVVRLRPVDDATQLTSSRFAGGATTPGGGRWCDGDPQVLIVFDAGYDVTRLVWLLTDLPVDLVTRLRSDRVFHLAYLPGRGRAGTPSPQPPAVAALIRPIWQAHLAELILR